MLQVKTVHSFQPMQHFNSLSFRYEEKLWVRSLAGKKQESENTKEKIALVIFNSKRSIYLCSITPNYTDEITSLFKSIVNKLPLVKQGSMYTS